MLLLSGIHNMLLTQTLESKCTSGTSLELDLEIVNEGVSV